MRHNPRLDIICGTSSKGRSMAAQDKTGIASYVGSGIAALIGAMTVQEWAAVTGIVLGVGTFAVNWYYRRKSIQAQVVADKAKADYYGGSRCDDTN